jgi:hypothetical protein
MRDLVASYAELEFTAAGSCGFSLVLGLLTERRQRLFAWVRMCE